MDPVISNHIPSSTQMLIDLVDGFFYKVEEAKVIGAMPVPLG